MDLKLKPFDFNQALARAGLDAAGRPLGAGRAQATGAAGAVEGGGNFRTAMADALRGVSAAQAESTRLQRAVAMDDPKASLEQTMIAMQRASLGFQATVQVRNRLVSAYTEIMNMQV